MLYSLRIYRRDGECLFEQHWTSGSTAHVVDHRTTFGLLFALKAFANQLTPIMYRRGVSCHALPQSELGQAG